MMEVGDTQTQTLEGQPLYAGKGEAVGEVDKVLYDKATGKPEWLAVRGGLLRLKSRLVPLNGAGAERSEGESFHRQLGPRPSHRR
jgi:PRC-barrel domain